MVDAPACRRLLGRAARLRRPGETPFGSVGMEPAHPRARAARQQRVDARLRRRVRRSPYRRGAHSLDPQAARDVDAAADEEGGRDDEEADTCEEGRREESLGEEGHENAGEDDDQAREASGEAGGEEDREEDGEVGGAAVNEGDRGPTYGHDSRPSGRCPAVILRRPGRVLPSLLVGFVVGLAIAGCSSGSGSAAPTTEPSSAERGLTNIDRAILGVNAARRGIADAMDGLVTAANRIDDADAAAATGRWQRVRDVRTNGPVDPTRVATLVARLPALVADYRAALDRLEAATHHTNVLRRQVNAVEQVLAVGQAEADADVGFVHTASVMWPAYAVLVGKIDLWYDRSSTGWYRTVKESASAYAVLISDDRRVTDSASQAFAAANQRRRDAAETYAATLAALRPILTGRTAPSPSVP